MADSTSKRGKQDRDRVSSKQQHEVQYLKEKYPDLTGQAISGAIRAVGPMRKDVIKYLKEKGKI